MIEFVFWAISKDSPVFPEAVEPIIAISLII